MKHNLSMASLMFDNLNTKYVATYLLSGTPNLDILDDPKYLLNGCFYYTNTLLIDLVGAGNTVLATHLGNRVDLTQSGYANLISSTNVSVVANGKVTWFICMVRDSAAALNSVGYSYLVHGGLVGERDTSDLIVANADISLGSPVKIASRKIRIVGHEQPPQ